MKKTISSKNYCFSFLLFCSFLFSIQAVAAGNANSTAELGNTYWKLSELAGEPVVTAEGQRQMKITLRDEKKVSGFGGCNSFFGAYEHDGATLSFSQLAATRMFCADAMDKESQFMKSLATVKSYKINGQVLQLFDDKGSLLVIFEAVYLK